MERIKYYDVSINQSLSFLSGKEVELTDLSRQKKLENPKLFVSNGYIDDISSFDFDPLGIKHSSRWEKVVATMIYAISDQIPNREEVKKGRQIIEHLPKNIKQKVDRQFVLGFLPYFLTGFNFHLDNVFVTDSNFIDDGVSFITEIYGKPSVHTWSLLCAHRESHKVKILSLRDHIHETKVLRALNLELGLLANAQIGRQTIDWYQQTPTLRASSNMFPEIFINYLKTSRIGDLMKILKLHQDETGRLMNIITSNNVHLNLIPLDSFTSLVETFLNERYGNRWRESQVIQSKNDTLVNIAYQATMPEVSRLMPFYECSVDRIKELEEYRSSNLKAVHDKNDQKLINEVFNWFIESQQMTKFGKALYDTAFYYLWGCLSATKGIVSIGIDRDHENYQYSAFRQGYIESSSTKTQTYSIPFVYARRVGEEKPKEILRYISFRQFWRDIN